MLTDFVRLFSAGGGEERALHVQPGLVGSGLPAVRDDRGPVAFSAAQKEDQARGGGATRQRGGRGVLLQVLRGRQVALQNGQQTFLTL